jgi:hypothetical protein
MVFAPEAGVVDGDFCGAVVEGDVQPLATDFCDDGEAPASVLQEADGVAGVD